MNTMQKLEQISFFDQGTIITVETEDYLYQDAEFIEVDSVEAYGDSTVRVMEYVLRIRYNGSNVESINENDLMKVTVEFK